MTASTAPLQSPEAPAPVTLLVVDDHTLFRRGLIALLGQDPGLQVLGEAGDAAEALRLAPQLQPQVILLDNHLPGVMGVDAIRGLREEFGPSYPLRIDPNCAWSVETSLKVGRALNDELAGGGYL